MKTDQNMTHLKSYKVDFNIIETPLNRITYNSIDTNQGLPWGTRSMVTPSLWCLWQVPSAFFRHTSVSRTYPGWVGWFVGQLEGVFTSDFHSVGVSGPSQSVRRDLWPLKHLIRVMRQNNWGVWNFWGHPEANGLRTLLNNSHGHWSIKSKNIVQLV